MIKVIRLKRLNSEEPAGEMVWFDCGYEPEDCEDVGIYLWGKDGRNYLVVKDGFEVEIDSKLDVDLFVEKLKNFKCE
jgi:hypothetical protein